MRKISAQLIFPVNGPPIQKGIIEVDDDGTIINVINTQGNLNEQDGLEFYNGILVPGFVNAHTHLELSWMYKKLPDQFSGMADFIKKLLALRFSYNGPVEEDISRWDTYMQQEGIVAVGDISNSTDTFKVKHQSKLQYYSFIEFFGLGESLADDLYFKALLNYELAVKSGLKAGLTPHAPYTMSGRAFELLKTWHEAHPNEAYSLHFQEAPDETQMVIHGKGKLMELFASYGMDTSRFPYQSTSVGEYVKSHIPYNTSCLFIHNPCASNDELLLLNKSCIKATFVVCPRSNMIIEQQLPDIQRMLSLGINVAIGTDSLASCNNLSVLDEMKFITANYKTIALNSLLQMATINGANALNLENSLGTFETGKKPGINLLTNLDLQNMRLLPETHVKRLI